MTIKVDVVDVLAACGLATSRQAARRMIRQLAVSIEGFKVTETDHQISFTSRLEFQVSGSPPKTVDVSQFGSVKVKEFDATLMDESLSVEKIDD